MDRRLCVEPTSRHEFGSLLLSREPLVTVLAKHMSTQGNVVFCDKIPAYYTPLLSLCFLLLMRRAIEHCVTLTQSRDRSQSILPDYSIQPKT